MSDLRRQALDVFGDLVDPDSRDEIERAIRVTEAKKQLKEGQDAGSSERGRDERHDQHRPRD